MLSQISWAEYLSFIFIASVIYYASLAWVYRKQIQVFAAAEPLRSGEPPIQASVYDEGHVIQTFKDEIEALLQNLSFFNSGNKTYTLEAVQEVIRRIHVQTPLAPHHHPSLTDFIIEKAGNYCEVYIHPDELEAAWKISKTETNH